MVRQTDAGVTASTRKAARRRAPLNRERVLRAALRLADRGGIDSVSMRHLGQELGVEAMTLYHYVASKDELLEGMVDLVTGEIELPSGDGVDWKAATRRRAISAREAFRRHPWASLLWIRLGIGPARIRYMDAALRAFREAGFSVELTEKAYHAVEDHIAGYTLQAQNFPLDAADLVEVGEAFYRALPRDQYPYLAEHVRQHLDVSGLDSEGEYAFGLGLILDGIERLWKEERRESSAERLSPGAPRGGGPSHPRP